MEQDSIIVYRNPAEKMIWESIMEGHFFYNVFILSSGMLIGFLVIYFGLSAIFNRVRFRNEYTNFIILAAIIGGIFLACFGVYKFGA